MAAQPIASRPQMEGYGIASDGTLMEWSDAEQKLRDSRNYWICTTRPDGRPHAMPVWGVWHDGALYWGTGASTVKARNLAANPAITVHLESGDDCIVVEGTAQLVPLAPVAEPLNSEFQRKYNMRMDDAAGADADVYEVRPATAFGWLEADFTNTATRWRWP